MPKLIINLYKLNLRELFNVRHQRASNIIEGAIGLTGSLQVNMHASICKDESAVPGKAVEHCGQSLVPFHIAGTFEEFIQHSSDMIF